MKIIIIGSCGFIGRNLVSFLQQNNHDVSEADIIFGEEPKYFMLDKVNPDFEKIFKENDFDICFNCSGAANVNLSVQNPLWDFELNTYNVYKILDAIRKYNNGCKFINLSSASVYGNPKTLPVSENKETRPISPYGYHKLAAENIGLQFTSLYDIRIINVRIFSVYGPGLTKQIFWDVFQKHKQNPDITLFGTGHETRDFIFIDDLCKALEATALNAIVSGVVNIATGKSTLIKDAVEILLKNFNKPYHLTFNKQQREGDPLFWEADITKFLNYGSFEFTSIEEGLKKTAEWMLTVS